ncbi:hypothetical protein RJ55_01945 [Drechmeria coniospora]|nr:hypothetical protein RJ55_01945 [Drechmeria coniospora]
MTQIDKLHAKGYTGKGIKIAMIDTGVDFTHPDLGGCYGPRCRISFGASMVDDGYNGTGLPVRTTEPPMDAVGHGTRIAGILIAQPNRLGFSGVVPDATLGIYRVFSLDGWFGGSDIYIAAFLEAYKDEATIITSSLGQPGAWPEDPWNVVVQRIVAKGVPCVLPAGNDGRYGPFFTDKPGSGRGAVSASSFDNTIIPAMMHKVKYSIDGEKDIDFGYITNRPSEWDDVILDLYATSTNDAVENDACRELPANTPDLSKRIVLVRGGNSNCSLDARAATVAAKGAKYIILYDTDPAMDLRIRAAPEILAIGAVTREVGKTWLNALLDGRKVTLRMKSPEKSDSYLITSPNNATAGAISRSTSWGPSFEMDPKPQFGAPGAYILSTDLNSRYSVSSGTSFSTPLIAGIIALVGQVRGTFDPALLSSLLSSTAKPQLFHDGERFCDYYAPTAQQGSGLVQAYDAAYATTLLSPSALSFNDTEHFIRSLAITIRNMSNRTVTYNVSHVPAITVYGLDQGHHVAAFPPEAIRVAATMNFSQNSITLGPGEATAVEVQPTPPPGLDTKRLALWSGWIAINGTDGAALSVPYQGLAGSLRNTKVLGPNDTWIGRSSDEYIYPAVNASTVFTIPGPRSKKDVAAVLPTLVANLTFGTPFLTVHVLPLNGTNFASGGTPLANFNQTYLPRRTQTPFPCDGRLDSGEYAPAGQYKFMVRALRNFGNVSNSADWDAGETLPFSIKYQEAEH